MLFPRKETWEFLVDGKISSLSRANREGHKEPFIPFLRMEWGD
jgi:hypothetical protein